MRVKGGVERVAVQVVRADEVLEIWTGVGDGKVDGVVWRGRGAGWSVAYPSWW